MAVASSVKDRKVRSMDGCFGVFCDADLISGTFCDDDSADAYMRELIEVGEYDAHHLAVREVPERYDEWIRLLDVLRAHRDYDTQEKVRQIVKEMDDAATRV